MRTIFMCTCFSILTAALLAHFTFNNANIQEKEKTVIALSRRSLSIPLKQLLYPSAAKIELFKLILH